MPLRLPGRLKKGEQRARGMLHELESTLRRLVFVPLLVPVLLFAGAGVGRVASDALEVPEDRDVVAATNLPRIRFEALGRFLDRVSSAHQEGDVTVDFVTLYRQHVEPVERSLLRRGVDAETARKVSWTLVDRSLEKDLDPATVLAVLLIESRGNPRATSFVGARGLMQVMPMHQGRWRGCGEDLYDIEDNLCYGTAILAWYLRVNGGDERRALLGYNGCVRGTNTPDCFRYPDKVRTIRASLRREWRRTATDVETLPPASPSAAAP